MVLRMTRYVETHDSLLTSLLPMAAPTEQVAISVADRTEQVDIRFELAVGMAEVISKLATEAGIAEAQALAPLLSRIVYAVPGVRCASLLVRSNRQKPPLTLAATEPLAIEFDQLQCLASQGPCLDSLGTTALIQVDDLTVDQRWTGLSSRQPVQIRSVLSVPVLAVEGASHGSSQSLNLYAEAPHAFAVSLHSTAYLAAAALGLALTALREREQAEHLRVALATNRQIGTAMGILMARHRCSSEDAFTALRVTSQHLHRKLREIADEVIYTGALPSRGHRRIPA